jgi:hypothetical protein
MKKAIFIALIFSACHSKDKYTVESGPAAGLYVDPTYRYNDSVIHKFIDSARGLIKYNDSIIKLTQKKLDTLRTRLRKCEATRNIDHAETVIIN